MALLLALTLTGLPQAGLSRLPGHARADAVLAATDMATLEAASGFRGWRCEVLHHSKAKWLPRRICRSPDPTLQMAVAETLQPDGSVRETEVVLADGSDGSRVHFLVFDSQGRRSDSADFGAPDHPVLMPAPAICLRCHADPATGQVHLRPAFALPAA